MISFSLNTHYIDDFLWNKKLFPQISISEAHRTLQDKTCKGADYLGWINLPEDMTDEKITKIQSYADSLRAQSDVLIVCGIGGSYLGARAIIEAFSAPSG